MTQLELAGDVPYLPNNENEWTFKFDFLCRNDKKDNEIVHIIFYYVVVFGLFYFFC